MRFEDLRLSEPLLRAIRAAGYEVPTPIQSSAIPHVLTGRDVLGCAQTGTGKTAAFAVPILERLGKGRAAENSTANRGAEPRHPAPAGNRRGGGRRPQPVVQTAAPTKFRALVLCPTRELAAQIHESFTTYARYLGIRVAVVVGGVGQHPQVTALRSGVDIVVATPGRLLDLMTQGHVNLTGVEFVVLDEADRMLDMGFLPDIRRILGRVPARRQSLLFSATMPPPIRVLAGEFLRDPVPVTVARVSSPAATVAQSVYHVEQKQKPALLVRLLAHAPGNRALVFTRTKHGADRLTRHLLEAGVRAVALHGNKSQGARTRALSEFRSAVSPVLVATDLAARGLDVDDIAQVINFDITPDPETYVHRIGRTGRAGASGAAVSFCSAEERGDLRAIERLLRAPLKIAETPSHESRPERAPASRREEPQANRPRNPTWRRGHGRSAAKPGRDFAAAVG